MAQLSTKAHLARVRPEQFDSPQIQIVTKLRQVCLLPTLNFFPYKFLVSLPLLDLYIAFAHCPELFHLYAFFSSDQVSQVFQTHFVFNICYTTTNKLTRAPSKYMNSLSQFRSAQYATVAMLRKKNQTKQALWFILVGTPIQSESCKNYYHVQQIRKGFIKAKYL